MRRAPKSHVKVESVPLPAPKPRSKSAMATTDERGLASSYPALADLGASNATSAISAINESAPAREDKETVAPFSSVLRNDTRADGETNLYSYQDRTTVEELPEEEKTLATGLPTPAPAIAPSPGQTARLLVEPVSAAAQEGRAGNSVSGISRSVDRHAAVGLATESLTAAEVMAAPPETTETGGQPSRVAAPDLQIVPTAATAKVSERSLSERPRSNVDPQGAIKREDAVGNIRSVPREGQPMQEDVAHPELKREAQSEGQEVSAPIRMPQQGPSSRAASVAGTATQRLQLPTTGYQFEHMWRSTDGSPKARLELLRAVPPSSIAKFFRRTPIEVDLLGSVLRSIGEALLPKKPATAVRWLKSLSKASRFSMTVALLEEADGRAAVREILNRLEAAPSAKVDPNDIQALRKQFLLS